MRQIRVQPRNPKHRSETWRAEAARSAARQETKAKKHADDKLALTEEGRKLVKAIEASPDGYVTL